MNNYPGHLHYQSMPEYWGHIATIQQALRNRGYSFVAVDGTFGPITAYAVRDFQRSKGLSIDGIVGPVTWGAL